MKLSSGQLNVSCSVGGSLAAGFGLSVWIELKSCRLCLASDGLGFPVGIVT